VVLNLCKMLRARSVLVNQHARIRSLFMVRKALSTYLLSMILITACTTTAPHRSTRDT